MRTNTGKKHMKMKIVKDNHVRERTASTTRTALEKYATVAHSSNWAFLETHSDPAMIERSSTNLHNALSDHTVFKAGQNIYSGTVKCWKRQANHEI